MLQFLSKSTPVRLIVGVGLFGFLAAAQADVKIVSHMHTDENGTTRPDQTITTYYKGNIVRTESGAAVTLLNTTTGKTAILRPWNKTFSVFNVSQLAPNNPSPGSKAEAHATVTQTSEHKVIAGKNATKFVADIDFTVTLSSLLARHTTMHIVRWTTTDVQMPVTSDVLEKYSPEQLTFRGFSGMDDVQKELAKITGLPLSSEITIKSEYTAPSGVGGVPTPSTEMTNVDVDSISTDALDDSLFVVPNDYKNMGGGPMGHLPGPGVGGVKP